MIVKEIKTIWAGRAWVHDKYLEQCGKTNQNLKLVKGNESMLIPFETFKTAFDRSKPSEDKIRGQMTLQHGIVWKPDLV